MPFLDVSEVLTDPDFVDLTLAYTRNAQTVGSNGLAINTPSTVPFSGVVTTEEGSVLDRIAEGERIRGSIVIHTKTQLIDGLSGFTADTVSWNGKSFTVTEVSDWSKYGAGFYAATCDLIPLNGS